MSLIKIICFALFAAEPNPTIDFNTEIIPVLTKAGCNSGACHGAAAGRGGFHLSLLGADPASDFEAIVQDLEGRRVNLARPESSLILAKPSGLIPHGGNVVLDEASPGAERVRSWIQAGAQRGTERRLTEFDLTPRRQICETLPARVALRVTASFDGGPRQDITAWTVFTSSDPAAVSIESENTIAIVKRRGQHVVMARFLDRILPMQFIVPLSDTAVDLTQEPRSNFIDEEILRTLSMLRLPVSPRADDATYLRRVRLDLTGRLPEPNEVREFLADSSLGKRGTLVEKLLTSDEFADYWTLRFARLLRIHSLPNEKDGVRAYGNWLHDAIKTGRPLDQMAKELLTATGDSHVVGPANFGRMVGDARGHAELVGQFFLGMRLGCANCHNHPLDKWTQDDYHGLAAVFARLDRRRNVQFTARGGVTNLRTGEPAIPRIPADRFLNWEDDHRSEVAEWLTSTDNPYFARATVNRLWRAMFGRGFVEPTDDLRETNPATHPELLDRLAADFAEHGYDLRHTLRQIALSHTYARSETIVPGNAGDDRFYSHAFRRPLGPEVLADAIADVTGVPHEYPDQPPGTRAIKLIDPLTPAPSLDLLGRCSRVGVCEESASEGGGLPAQLHFLNGTLINQKLSDKEGRLQQLIQSGKSDAEIMGEFHLRALGRTPTNSELKRWCEKLETKESKQRIEGLEDFVWSLLNSRNFVENR